MFYNIYIKNRTFIKWFFILIIVTIVAPLTAINQIIALEYIAVNLNLYTKAL